MGIVFYLILALGNTTLTVLPHEFPSLAACEISAEHFRGSPKGSEPLPRRSAYCLPALVGTTGDEAK